MTDGARIGELRGYAADVPIAANGYTPFSVPPAQMIVSYADGVAGSSSITTADTPPTPPSFPTKSGEQPGDWVGPYKLLELIGEGGFGTVWLAERREPIVQRVALKIIKAGMDTRAVVARFEQERQALAVMDHPNVAKVFDAGATTAGRPYFVMEHVPGDPITDYADKHMLSVRQRLELFVPVCNAVQHAHQKGIIHRDLKPSNILVAVKDSEALPKIIDFGVAKAISHTLTDKTIFTETGQLLGTPEYMSPEQAEMGATDIDTRTDVYSLGVVLYELLSGLLPFDSESLRAAGYDAIRRLLREQDPPKPSTRLSTADKATGEGIARHRVMERQELARELRRELDWIPLKALRKDRVDRYKTVEELAVDVRNYLTGRPLIAGPESWRYIARKFVRRNKGPVIAVGAVFAALLLGVGTTLWQASVARQRALAAEDAESEQRRLAITAAAAAKHAAAQQALAEHRSKELALQAYIGNLLAADAALNANQRNVARHRLDACPETLRHWEWKYLDSTLESSIFTISRAQGTDAVFSPDGNTLYTSAADGSLNIWQAATGKLIRSIPCGFNCSSYDISLSADGRLALLLGEAPREANGSARGTGHRIIPFDLSRQIPLVPINDTLSSGSRRSFLDRVLIGGRLRDPTKLYDLTSSKVLGSWAATDLFTHPGAIDPSARFALISPDTGPPVLVDARSGTLLREIDVRPSISRQPLASPDGSRFFIVDQFVDRRTVANADRLFTDPGQLYAIDAATGDLLYSRPYDDKAATFASPGTTGHLLVVVTLDGRTRVWNAKNGELLQVLGSPAGTRWAGISPDERWLFTQSSNRLLVWSLQSGKATVDQPLEFDSEIQFTPDSTRLIVIQNSQITRVSVDGSNPSRPLGLVDYSPRKICVAADHELVAVAGSQGVRVWRTDSDMSPKRIPRQGGSSSDRLASGASDHLFVNGWVDGDSRQDAVAIFDMRALAQAPTVVPSAALICQSTGWYVTQAIPDATVAGSKDNEKSRLSVHDYFGRSINLDGGTYEASGAIAQIVPGSDKVWWIHADGTLREYDLQTGALGRTVSLTPLHPRCLCSDPVTSQLLLGTEEGYLVEVDTTGGTSTQLRIDDQAIGAIAVNADGSRVLCERDRNRNVPARCVLLKRGSSTPVLEMNGEQYRVPHDERAVATFSSDGQWVLYRGSDGCIHVLDSRDGAQRLLINALLDIGDGFALSRDCKRLLTWGRDGALRFWETSSGQEVFALQFPRRNGIIDAAFDSSGERLVVLTYREMVLYTTRPELLGNR